MIADWFTVTTDALINLWQGFLSFIPSLIGAIIIFVIGWIVSVAFAKLIAGILKKLRFNQMFEKGVWKDALEKNRNANAPIFDSINLHFGNTIYYSKQDNNE